MRGGPTARERDAAWARSVPVQLASAGAFLGLVLAWPLLPTTGLPRDAVRQWHDQRVLLGSVESLLNGTWSPESDQGRTGPGYLALAVATRALARVDAVEAVILLSRLSLYVAFVLLLCSSLLRVGRRAPRIDPLALAVVALLGLLTGMSAISSVPWTHFPAVALGLAALAALRCWPAFPRVSALALGAVLALLVQTRSFESRALLLVLAAVAVVAVVRRWRELRTAVVARLAGLVIGAAAVVWLLLWRVTGSWTVFEQYSGLWTASDRALSPVSLLTTLPQVLVDPCFHAVCAEAPVDVAPTTRLVMVGTQWGLPLLNQLAVLPVAAVTGVVLVAVALRRRVPVPADVQAALLLCAVLALGYLANPVMGGPHLVNGVVRDFLLPAACAVWALGRLLVVLRHPAHAGAGGTRAVTATATAAVLAALALMVAPLPRFPGAVVADYVVSPASCASWPCDVTATITYRDGSTSTTTDVIAIQLCDGRPTHVVDRDLVVRIPPDGRMDPCSGQTSVGILPRSLGAWMTPEGTAIARHHAVLIGSRT